MVGERWERLGCVQLIAFDQPALGQSYVQRPG